MFLNRTIDDILCNSTSKTEIIAILDGAWPFDPIKDNDRVTLIHHSKSIGQRASMNKAVKLSKSKYIMKCDAHCSFDSGFDVKLLNDMQDNWTMVPVMKNLHAFNWVCENGHKRYQSPSGPCQVCGEPTFMEIVWISKDNPQSSSYRFDRTLHFQYWREYSKRHRTDDLPKNLTETMSLQGSCFLLTCEKYWELEIADEAHGSWGQQGTEVACKTWLSGGRVVVNHNTWYSHLFRTQGGDFGFPYPIKDSDVEKARVYSKELFIDGKWDKAIYPISWLIKRFDPVPDWEDYV